MFQTSRPEDKRNAPRYKLDFSISVQNSAGLSKATLVEISTGGCKFQGAFKSRVGDILSVYLFPNYQSPSPDFRAKVVWKMNDIEGVSYGGNFWAVHDDEKVRLIRRILSRVLAVAEDPGQRENIERAEASL